MSGARNLRGGLVLLAAGLVAGLAMALYAFEPLVPPPAALADYDSLPRRLLRLAHVAAVMLPLLNIVLAPLIDRVRLSPRGRAAASWALLAGAAGLPAALALQAVWPMALTWHLAAPPALAFVAGVVLLAAGAWRTPARELAGDPASAPWRRYPPPFPRANSSASARRNRLRASRTLGASMACRSSSQHSSRSFW